MRFVAFFQREDFILSYNFLLFPVHWVSPILCELFIYYVILIKPMDLVIPSLPLLFVFSVVMSLSKFRIYKETRAEPKFYKILKAFSFLVFLKAVLLYLIAAET